MLRLSAWLLAFCPAAALAAPATAIPPVAPSAPTEPGDYPLNGQGTPKNSPQAAPQAEKLAEIPTGWDDDL